MIPRHATVIDVGTPQVLYREINAWTPSMRVRAVQRLAAKRKRPIWHTIPGWKRVVHTPCP